MYDESMEQWYPDENSDWEEAGITVRITNVKSEHILWLIQELKETLDMAGAIEQSIDDDTEPVCDVRVITRRTRLNGKLYVRGSVNNAEAAQELSYDLEDNVEMMNHRVFKPSGGRADVEDRWC